MPTNLDTSIASIIARAAADIAQAIRGEASAPVARAAAAPSGKRRGRPPGSGKAQKAAAPPAAAQKPAKGKRGKAAKGGRRTSAQVAADDAKILAFVKGHGGLRSEQIEKQMGFPKPSLASGLLRLRASGKVKMKGVKRAATYSA
jgi:hypothetical protein